jgi:hypothetical protein
MATAKQGPARARRYWLFKSEPSSYGFAQLQSDGRTFWSGVRNYQARNLLRDEIKTSATACSSTTATPSRPPIVGIAKVVQSPATPIPTAVRRRTVPYHDPDSDPADADAGSSSTSPAWGRMRQPVDARPAASSSRPSPTWCCCSAAAGCPCSR